MAEHERGLSARIAVIGAGAIGTALATVFADAGASVGVAEPDAARREGLAEAVRRQHAAMALAGLARDEAGAAVSRLSTAPEAATVAEGADLVIEAGPERLDAKRALFATLLAAAPPETPIATASSAITISEILSDPAQRRRAMVAHPVNPPTIIRVLELVPAPETDPAAVDRAAALFSAAGFAPARLGREMPGFVFNRLQGAVLREAYRLVAEGVIDVDGLDRLVRDGLGPRWALSGPFETADLNTAGGIADHAARMGPAYKAIGEARGERDCDWPPALVARVEAERRALVPEAALVARRTWRETALARLIAARNALLSEAADG